MKVILVSAFAMALQVAGCPVPQGPQRGGIVVNETRQDRSVGALIYRTEGSYVASNGRTYRYYSRQVTIHRAGQAYPDPPYPQLYVDLGQDGTRNGYVECVPNTEEGCRETVERHLQSLIVPDTGEEDGGYGGGY